MPTPAGGGVVGLSEGLLRRRRVRFASVATEPLQSLMLVKSSTWQVPPESTSVHFAIVGKTRINYSCFRPRFGIECKITFQQSSLIPPKVCWFEIWIISSRTFCRESNIRPRTQFNRNCLCRNRGLSGLTGQTRKKKKRIRNEIGRMEKMGTNKEGKAIINVRTPWAWR